MLNDLLHLMEQSGDPTRLGPWAMLAASWGWAFLFALARFLGLLVLSPVFGQRTVSIWLRLGLAICLAAVMAPLLLSHGIATLPTDGWEGTVRLLTELVIGALLGLGVLFVFSALKLAGEFIDQQAGIAVQEVFDPSGSGTSTLSGQLLTVVGTLALLCAIPGQGYLKIVATLIDSCLSTPEASIGTGEAAVVWLGHLGQQSLLLALQVAAPVLAAGVIVSWGAAAIGGGAGGGPVSATLFGLPLRIVLSLLLLAMGLTGMTNAFLLRLERIWQAFPVVFNTI